MKKRDFIAGFCCGVFVLRALGSDLSDVYQIFAVALVVLALSFIWEWIKNTVTIDGKTDRNTIIKRLNEYTNNIAIHEDRLET